MLESLFASSSHFFFVETFRGEEPQQYVYVHSTNISQSKKMTMMKMKEGEWKDEVMKRRTKKIPWRNSDFTFISSTQRWTRVCLCYEVTVLFINNANNRFILCLWTTSTQRTFRKSADPSIVFCIIEIISIEKWTFNLWKSTHLSINALTGLILNQYYDIVSPPAYFMVTYYESSFKCFEWSS